MIRDRLTSASSKSTTNTAQSPAQTLMEYIEKGPVSPPPYSFAHQNGASTRFPIYEQPETYVLPSYSPTIYKITLVLRKVEFVSPYEASGNRTWRNLIMELNSTQVNFYTMDGLPILDRAKNFNSKKNYRINEIEHSFIVNTLYNEPLKYLTPENLVKSYSLQHAKLGIPIDYKKRKYCLRLRMETEQMIVQFPSLVEMIDWSNFLSTGINVSLDLDTREAPKDRTVPRRRRRRNNRHRSYSDSELMRMELSGHPDTYNSFAKVSGNGVKNRISKIFGRKRSNTAPPPRTLSSFHSSTQSQNVLDRVTQAQLAIKRNSYHSTPQLHNPLYDIGNMRRPSDASAPIRQANQRADGEDDDSEEEDEEEEETNGLDDLEGDEIPDHEIHSIHELHDDSDDESIHPNSRSITNHFGRTITHYSYSNNFRFTVTDDSDHEIDIVKWLPDKKAISNRKFFKDSLRCIKVLTHDENWVGKVLVRSATPPLFPTSNKYARSTSKNKFVKEFIVGSQGLKNINE